MRQIWRYLALALVLPFSTASAQWVQTNGPYGGMVSCFGEYEGNIFAGTGRGISLSTDHGSSWTHIYAGSTVFLDCMAAIPDETGEIHMFGG